MNMKAPRILFYNHQREHQIDVPMIRRIVQRALPACMKDAKSADAPVLSLTEIEVTFVSDEAISKVHRDFLNDDSPTDVISFDHGEIFVSVDTALRQGAEHGEPIDRELCLYIIHGLLHLAGWDDRDAAECAAMHHQQSEILQQAFAHGTCAGGDRTERRGLDPDV